MNDLGNVFAIIFGVLSAGFFAFVAFVIWRTFRYIAFRLTGVKGKNILPKKLATIVMYIIFLWFIALATETELYRWLILMIAASALVAGVWTIQLFRVKPIQNEIIFDLRQANMTSLTLTITGITVTIIIFILSIYLSAYRNILLACGTIMLIWMIYTVVYSLKAQFLITGQGIYHGTSVTTWDNVGNVTWVKDGQENIVMLYVPRNNTKTHSEDKRLNIPVEIQDRLENYVRNQMSSAIIDPSG